ncbi:MAG: cobalt-precorrin-5B (C(1))-methyltransferase CbiD [Anaerotignaceae bacterium]
MPFEYYITQNNKRLKCGYTTGSCAAMAAKAACMMLLTGKTVEQINIPTPKGIEVWADVTEIEILPHKVSCAIVKDGGDDIDATHGLKIFATVRRTENGIIIDGGTGVGRVTKKGLNQPVGNAAINSVPRKMIEGEVLKVCQSYGYKKGIEVIISVPLGEEVAKKTFNPRLGIVGGISIIGSSGIVEPQSLKAISDTIYVEMKMLSKNGITQMIATPGNYGEAFIKAMDSIKGISEVKCSNFSGDTLDYAVELGFKKVLLIGHIGKFVKLAGGIMNTHSSFADCRMEILAAHGAMFGADAKKIMDCITTDEVIGVLDKEKIREQVMKSVIKKAEYHVAQRVHNEVETGVIMFSNQFGLLAVGENAQRILKSFGGSDE